MSTPKTTSKREDLQGLRGLAVLAVVGYHLEVFFPSGYFGVDVFFVLSGFLITQILIKELTQRRLTTGGGASMGSPFLLPKILASSPGLACCCAFNRNRLVFRYAHPI